MYHATFALVALQGDIKGHANGCLLTFHFRKVLSFLIPFLWEMEKAVKTLIVFFFFFNFSHKIFFK